VARASGRPFWDYVRWHVFTPAGLTRTCYDPPPSAEVAHTYGPPGPDGRRPDLSEGNDSDRFGGGPAGGGVSSAPELLAFARALWDGNLLEPSSVRLISGGKYPISPGKASSGVALAAYGMYEYIVNDQRVIRRTGTSRNGIAVSLSIYPDLDWVGVLLSNYLIDRDPYHQLQDEIVTTT
jgi:CubicO group peptidase (beta-lactamase class C family)